MPPVIPGPPEADEFAPYYAKYIAHVSEADIVAACREQLAETLALLRGIPESEAEKLHAPYTWTIKQVVGHIIDGERVFGYRALRFARHDTTPLPGFDENAYMKHANFNARPLADLAVEFELVRRSHVVFFGSLDDSAWRHRGTANDAAISVRALAYIVLGHERHHVAIVRRRVGR